MECESQESIEIMLRRLVRSTKFGSIVILVTGIHFDDKGRFFGASLLRFDNDTIDKGLNAFLNLYLGLK